MIDILKTKTKKKTQKKPLQKKFKKIEEKKLLTKPREIIEYISFM